MPVGESLARAREQRGLSVEDVSEATRIRATLVRAIEADDYRLCGGTVYARGHIRSIGHVVGIDPEPLIEEFDRDHGGSPAAAVLAPAFDPEVAESTATRRPNWSAAMLAALLVVIVLAAVPLLTGSNGHGSRPTAQRNDTHPTASAGQTTPPATATSSPPLVAQVPPGIVTVQLRVVRDKTWCSVRNAAGATLFEGLLSAGDQKLFKDAKGLRLIIGNAPAVDLIVNGHDIGSPPAQGNVSRVSVGPGDANVTAG